MDRRHFLAASAAAIGAATLPQKAAAAEVGEISIARGFAIPHLPVMIVEHQKLYEKHLAAAGLAATSVKWSTIGSGAVMNDALLSNTLSFATGGIPPMVTLWAKTKGTPLEVRGVCGQALMPLYLNTRNAGVKTIGDFGPNDRIAVGGIKTSIQAILLQMQATKQFGISQFSRLDELTVGLNAVDATTAVRSPNNPITSNVSIPPFQYEELRVPGIHRVWSSYDVVGEPHTFSIVWSTSRFRDQNPLSYRAFVSAIREATDLIQNDKPAVARMYIDAVKAKNSTDEIVALLNDPKIIFTMTPKGTQKFADFMYQIGTIKQKPASWKDLYFPDIHDLQGS
jgi:NitT/TauT family transport system substrate-binding protein